MRKPCKVDGCDSPSAGRGWCQKHWTRWRKHGDPTVVKPKVRPFKYGPTCSVDECTRPHHANGYCAYHNHRNMRNGHPTAPVRQGRPHKGSTVGYDGAHMRVKRLRGQASQYPCADCGKPASEWSYGGGGFPPGWLDGLTPAQQLKAAGNAVCQQQAELALRILLGDS